MDIRFTLDVEPTGKAAPQNMPIKDKAGNVKRVLHGVKNKKTRQREQVLAMLMREKIPADMPLIETPVMLHWLAVFARPKTPNKELIAWHRARGLPTGPDNRLWCMKKPDIDNIRKSIQDAMKTIWRDDSQVTAGFEAKVYGAVGERPKLIIRLTDDLPEVQYLAALYGLVDGARLPPPREFSGPAQPGLFDSSVGS